MTGLAVLSLCLALLLLGYRFYARFAERVYGAASTDSPMPCDTQADGVDYVRMPTWRVFLIQLLNITGLGPVFGALAGALFGPISLVWIVLGCIFAGGMHDLLAAHLSLEHGGENLPETVGRVLGRGAKLGMNAVCLVLLLLVGVVFTKGPADMMHTLVGSIPSLWWAALILLYYFLATILPINLIIGRIYPLFGALLLFMAVGMGIMLPFCGHELLPQTATFATEHPQGLSAWPLLFVTSCCGAISGFHATQSPMMVRCLGNKRHMRRVFYGAMAAEAVVALIWATVGLTLRDIVLPAEGAEATNARPFCELVLHNPAAAVRSACADILGQRAAILAVLGVVALAITTGDTAMRTGRLILAEAFHLEQRTLWKRLVLSFPLFAAVLVLSQVDFSIVWRYCGWATQCLACFTLWSLAVVLRRRQRCHWVATLPALFMTCMCATYILHAPEGARLPLPAATALGTTAAAACLVSMLCRNKPLG